MKADDKAQFNRIFAGMDGVFEDMEKFMSMSAKNSGVSSPDTANQRIQRVRFSSSGVLERARLAWKLCGKAVSVIFRGHATIVFKVKKP